MALNISTYTDPGVYIGEVLAPGSVAVTTERSLCIVGIAPRTRRVTDEAVIRGKVFEETLGSWTASSPYDHELVNVSNRDRNNAVLRKNDTAMGLGEWSFRPAYIRGIVAATADTSTRDTLVISMDGKAPLTITLTNNAALPVATAVSDINSAFAGSGTYGATYATVAAVVSNSITLTSPTTDSSSDITLYHYITTAEDASQLYFGAGAELGMIAAPTPTAASQAKTIVRVIDASYSATATFDIDYVSVETQTDPLTQATSDTPLSSIVSVGSFPGAGDYTKDYDYEKNGNTVDWFTTSWDQATFTGAAGPYNITAANDTIKIGINGLTPIEFALTNGGAQTAAAVAADINTALVGSSYYGPAYAYTASDSGGSIKLDVPSTLENFTQERGSSSTLDFYEPSATSGMTTVFALGSSSLPYEKAGTGSRPSFGTVYYATYDYTRDSSEYDNPVQVFDTGDLYDFCSPLTSTNYTTNKLAIAGEIAFENNATSVWLQLVDDATVTGSPTPTQIKTAIDNCANKSSITDVVVLDTTQEIAAYLLSHVSTQSSFINKNYRRGWYGMARSTDIGDPDTPDTFVYRSTRTLQVSGDSPGRGRSILVGPSDVSRTLTLSDRSEVSVNLDSTYLATGIAALFTSLPSPSDALVRRTIIGFNTSDFQTYLKAERAVLADNGVCVVTLDAGNLRLLDPLTTEAGGGGIVQFEEPQSSAQKDAVSRAVETILDANLVGIVPSSLEDFLIDVKSYIASAIRSLINSGAIGPYRDNSGATRAIDPLTDIKVAQSTTDPRTFNFKYWFNLKYPAKRFFGEYSVDNPFFNG